MIYHKAFQLPISPAMIESHLKQIAAVVPQWRYTMYPTTHFHSTTHEVLCVSRGQARLCFGGEHNESRVEPVVEQGDVIIVPAGVAHRLLEEIGPGSFEMVGSYPEGCNWDMCFGCKDEEAHVNRIKELPWFRRDPIYGDQGPVLDEDVQGTTG